jgi:hypothetical protein
MHAVLNQLPASQMFQQSAGVVSLILKKYSFRRVANGAHTTVVCVDSVCVCRLTLLLFSSEHKVKRCNPPPRGSDVDAESEDNTTLSLESQIPVLGTVLGEPERRVVIVGSGGTHSPDVC